MVYGVLVNRLISSALGGDYCSLEFIKRRDRKKCEIALAIGPHFGNVYFVYQITR